MKKILSLIVFLLILPIYANAWFVSPPSSGGTDFFSGPITDEQLLCGENTDGVNRIKSCGAKSVDNSTASHVLSKDNSGEIENLTLDNHLSLTGTTSPTLSVVTPTIDGSAHVNLTAAQMAGNGVIVTNYGQTNADVVVGLPAAASGLSGLFTVATAQSNHWGVQADTNDKIYLISAAGTVAAGSDGAAAVMDEAQLGQSFACWTFQSGDGTWDWMCKAISIGTSTFEAHAAISSCGDSSCTGFLVCQNFEGTGYDNSESWTEAGTGTKDEDYTTSPAPLRGSQSLYISGSTANAYVAAAASEVWGHFILQVSDGQPSSDSFIFLLASTNVTVKLLTTGYLQIIHGTANVTSTTTQFADGATTPVRIWYYYKKSSGSNDGILTIWLSDLDTKTRPASPEVTISTGNHTGNTTNFSLYIGTTSTNIIIDQALVKTSEFTTVCE